MFMNFTEYQIFTRSTIAYSPEKEKSYVERGLVGEVGEVLGVLAKYDRGDFGEEELHKRLSSELGDILWFLARLSDTYGIAFDFVANKNRDKLTERMKKNTIKGDGEVR